MSGTTTLAEPRAVGVGLLMMATAVGSLALLGLHPGGEARDFAGMLGEEAANRLMNAVVHGGFVVVLLLELIGYTVFARRLSLQKPAAVAGLVFFAAGAMFMSASLIIDGIVTPAIAAKYVAAPEKLDFARSLFVLIQASIGVLMPAGLFLQSLAVAAWGFALLAKPTPSRAAGFLAIVIGAVLAAALALTVAAMNPIVLMGAIALLALWAFIAGLLLCSSEASWS